MSHDAMVPNDVFELASNLADVVSLHNGTSMKRAYGLKMDATTMCSAGSKDVTAPANCKDAAMEQFLAKHRMDVPAPARADPALDGNSGGAPVQSDAPIECKVEVKVAKLPLTAPNIVALSVLTVFAVLGAIYVWVLGTRNRCGCKLCKGEYVIERLLGKVQPACPWRGHAGTACTALHWCCAVQGGFGEVFLVTRSADQKQLVLKKCIVSTAAEANQAQDEAKELRRLKHPCDLTLSIHPSIPLPSASVRASVQPQSNDPFGSAATKGNCNVCNCTPAVTLLLTRTTSCARTDPCERAAPRLIGFVCALSWSCARLISKA